MTLAASSSRVASRASEIRRSTGVMPRSLAESNGMLRVLSSPRVLTLDNREARISQGTLIPFSQVSAQGVQTTFQEAKLQLLVKPHVTADGTVLLQTPASMLTIYPHIYKKLPYEPFKDLAPVSLACSFEFALGVGPAVPASVTNVPELMAWLKANPDQANFGSPAAGSTTCGRIHSFVSGSIHWSFLPDASECRPRSNVVRFATPSSSSQPHGYLYSMSVHAAA